jgi:sugar transferase (PEP-CTERM/EpsH1 system associated)
MLYSKTEIRKRHVVHLVYRFATGGLENVVLQLVNHLPQDSFRHTVIAVSDVDHEFAQRNHHPFVETIALEKPPGQAFALYPKFYKILRSLQPDVLHSCNLAALEFQPVAALARVPLRVHAEHGMDMAEIGEKAVTYRRLRKLYKPFVSQYVAVSTALHSYLRDEVGAPHHRLHLIPNGVDTDQFRPRKVGDPLPLGFPFQQAQDWVIGTVGRQVEIKNPMLLVEAFVALAHSGDKNSHRLRLAMVGDGPLRKPIAQRMHAAGLEDRLWLPGVRSDVAQILRAFDCFVLPSLSEATSCTLQEAMATGLPIVATDVGGNADLLERGNCGILVPSGDAGALASAMLSYSKLEETPSQALTALASVNMHHRLMTMIQHYQAVFTNEKTPENEQ